jgi:hypothetical protein
MDHTGYIYYTAWISLFSSLYGFYRGHSDLALLQGLTFLASINYWRKPVYGCRRNTDIFAVVTTAGYHSIRAFGAENGNTFYTFFVCGVGCYALSWYYYRNNKRTISGYLHNGVHIFACVSTVYLYSGSIDSLLYVEN